MSVVDLHNHWASFWERLVLLSAFAEPTTASGVRLARTAGLSTEAEVVRALRQLSRSNRLLYPSGGGQDGQPKWSDPARCSSSH